MDYIKTVRDFINPNNKSNVLLIKGDWGVGKTYTVNSVLPRDKENTCYLSLFGVKNISDLNLQLLEKTSIKAKTIKKAAKYLPDFGVGYEAISINFTPSKLFNILADMKFKDKKQKFFIIDDIERKDNKLSLLDIFGFIDSLHLKESKFILIMNDKEISRSDDAKSLKGLIDKTVDEILVINKPTIKTKCDVFGSKDILTYCNDAFLIADNLRIIKKFKNIVQLLRIEINNKSSFLLNSILYYLLFENDPHYFINSIINNETKESVYIQNLSVNGKKDKKLYNEIYDEISKEYKNRNLSLKDWYVKYLSNLDEFSQCETKSLRKVLSDVYFLMSNTDYKSLINSKFELNRLKRKPFSMDYLKIYLNSKPGHLIEIYLKKILTAYRSKNYAFSEIYKQFSTFYCEFKAYIDSSSNAKMIVKNIIEGLFADLSEEMISKNFEYDNTFNGLQYFNNPTKRQIFNYLLDELFIYIKTTYFVHYNFKTLKAKRSIFDQSLIKYKYLLNVSKRFDLTKTKDFISLNKEIVDYIYSRILKSISEKYWQLFLSYMSLLDDVDNLELKNYAKSVLSNAANDVIPNVKYKRNFLLSYLR